MLLQRWAGVWTLAVSLCASVAPAQAFEPAAPPQIFSTQEATIEAAFAPWDDIESLLLKAFNQARRQILVQAYILTSRPLTQGLAAASARGIDVRVLLDAGQLNQIGQDCMAVLRAAGVKVALETRYKSAHNKVIVIDATTADATVITGSYNFTWAAQHKNAENMLFARRNLPLAARYVINWMRHFQDAEVVGTTH